MCSERHPDRCLLLISSQTKGRGKCRKICPTEIFREPRKLELAAPGAEPGLHPRGSSVDWQSPVDFWRIVSRLHRLRALPNHGIQILPAQQCCLHWIERTRTARIV